MRPTDLPADVLIDPTPAAFQQALQTRLAAAYELGPEIAELHLAAVPFTTPEGFREYAVIAYTGPFQQRRTFLTLAWWSDRRGHRYIRIKTNAQCNGASTPYQLTWPPFTPWAAVFEERAVALNRQRRERIRRILARRLGTGVLQMSAELRYSLSDQYRYPFLLARTADALLLAENRTAPVGGLLIVRDAHGVHHASKPSSGCFDPRKKRYRDLGTGPARLAAALDELFQRTLAPERIGQSPRTARRTR